MHNAKYNLNTFLHSNSPSISPSLVHFEFVFMVFCLKFNFLNADGQSESIEFLWQPSIVLIHLCVISGVFLLGK